MRSFYTSTCALLTVTTSLLISGCNNDPAVSFSQDIQPIIAKHCIDCHVSGGAGYEASGFALDSYEGIMKGTRNGPMVLAGDSAGSNMLVLMEGRADPSISMPHGDLKAASAEELAAVRAWIDQGAKNN